MDVHVIFPLPRKFSLEDGKIGVVESFQECLHVMLAFTVISGANIS